MLIQLIDRCRGFGVMVLLGAAAAVPAGCAEEPETRTGRVEGRSAVESAAAEERAPLPEAAAEPMADLLDAYFRVGDALAGDTAEGVEPDARRIAEAAGALAEVDSQEAAELRERGGEIQIVREQAEAVAEAGDLEAARLAYGELSDALERLVRAVGVPGGYGEPVYGFVCGMAEGVPRKGVWLQADEDARNPYFGSRMPACHSEEFVMPVAGRGGS